jgi:hypothetical protein
MLAILIVVGILRGNGSTPSTIGVVKCLPLDNGLIAILIIFGIILTTLGAFLNRIDYKRKKNFGYKFT